MKLTQQPPDLAKGVAASAVPESGLLLGHVGEDEVVLARSGAEYFAIGAHCTHYRGPLAEGLIDGDTVRCPLHHACFSLRTGDALRAPAFDPIPCWRVEQKDGLIFVREKLGAPQASSPEARTSSHPSSVLIIGGGAAGSAAADMLRREGYSNPITIVSAETDPPVDRPNLSKDFLAGEAQDDWMPIWPESAYAERGIELLLGRRVVTLDPVKKAVRLDDGSQRDGAAILLATGADPVRIPVPGASDRVFYLRSFADARAIVAQAESVKRALVVGASFIGLEVAASLRTRGLAVDVVGQEHVPLARVMGEELGRFIRSVHESRGVVFHLGDTLASFDGKTARLNGGTAIPADFVVMGIGVRPATTLAEQAGLTLDRGIVVNEYLETSEPGIFAAGDLARWPDPHTGERIRVEHWVVAQRQGQIAARNMLGERVPFDAVPYFWSNHYDVAIRYVGHAERWDAVHVDGSLDARDAAVTFSLGGRRLAVATIGRNRENLVIEEEMENS